MAVKHMRNLEFELYPKYKQAYIRAFDKMLQKREIEGRPTTLKWADGQAVFDWWLSV